LPLQAGNEFYGFDLKTGRMPSADEIVAAVQRYPFKEKLTEVYYCGIGEPLLRYNVVVETAPHIRSLLPAGALLAINTSGTFFSRHPKVDFVREFDLVQVSLNAENEEKYNLICKPKTPGAYRALMSFLTRLRSFLDQHETNCRVELSVVDTSIGPQALSDRTDVQPDIEACRHIAAQFGWPLKVKALMKDFDSDQWTDFARTFRSSSDLLSA
jgi:organic radical activating enzyme